jgi:hypothetical protein
MDEQRLPDKTRREGVESVPIQLADGNFWGLALPRTRVKPRVVTGVDMLGRPIESIQIATEFCYPLQIRRLIEELRFSAESGTAEGQHQALFRLAASLVRSAHDLELEEVVELLEMDLKDLPTFIRTVLSVVTGEYFETTDSPGEKETDV